MFCLKKTLFALVLTCALIMGIARADFYVGPATNLGAIVNSSSGDFQPYVSPDGLSLYFASTRPGGSGREDIWVTTRATTGDAWTPPTNLGSSVNNQYWEKEPCVSADGLTLYFESSRPNGTNNFPHIYFSTRPTIDDPWGWARNLGQVNRECAGPCISADGLSLFLHSDRAGGIGPVDLYVATRPSPSDDWGPWTTTENLGKPINSTSVDLSPHVSPDGRVLFFNSNRPGGIGAHDLWMTIRAAEGNPWRNPVNLGPEINTTYDDAAPCISSDGFVLYFNSNRPGGSGHDIWQAPILPVVDFNGDGTVDTEDKAILVDHWGQDGSLCDIGPMPWGDGIVDSQDLWVLAEYVDVDDVVMVHTPSVHAADVSLDVTLHWLPVEIADTHDVYFGDVYFGTSFDDVYAASRDDPRDVLVSQGQSANDFDPGQLACGQTYYWRIDAVTATFEPTIYRGVVVDFTTELLAYPVGNVSATASTSDAGAGPENTVNGSGLNDEGEHATAATDMWLASGNGVDPIWIQYEFDKVYKLHEMLVWNYNVQFELVLGLGLKDVTVAYSENGMDWTVLGDVELAQATAAATYTANTTIEFGGEAAKYVRLTVNGGWGITGKFGLSEVRFYHIPTRARKPEPGDGETGVSPDTILSWHAGREAALHEVYLSADRQAVVDGTALVDTVTENGYLPEPLDPGQTYYWKINEINEAETVSAWEGDVWVFTTAE